MGSCEAEVEALGLRGHLISVRQKYVRCRWIDAPQTAKAWGPHDRIPGKAAYEERITFWRAASAEGAIAFAEGEANGYATVLESEYVGLAQSYRLADTPGNGAELFSLIRRSALGAGAYVDKFFDTGAEYQRDVEEP